MSDAHSRFILWFRMQSLRQDAIGDMVRAVHQDQAVLSLRMYSDVRRYLHQANAHRALLPVFDAAEREFNCYHKRQFTDMPCLVCRASLTALPREDVDVIWQYHIGMEGHTYGFLHKPCFVRIDQPALAVETLDTFLSPQHGYKRHLPRAWWDALIRLWPLKKVSKKPLKASLKTSLAVRAVVLPVRARGLTLSTRFDILKRDQYRCRLCGTAARDGDHVRLEVDHIIARYRGGTDETSNLWTLCFACNRGKGAKDL